MAKITASDGTRIFSKGWGQCRPIVFRPAAASAAVASRLSGGRGGCGGCGPASDPRTICID